MTTQSAPRKRPDNQVHSVTRHETFRLEYGHEDLLDARQVASFVCDGFLLVEGVVPEDLNVAAREEMLNFDGAQWLYWKDSELIQRIFRLPQVGGAIGSLVGREPGVELTMPQVVVGGDPEGQTWHFDSLPEVRDLAFDLLCFYYPQDTPEEMAATLVLPGSHVRRVNGQGTLSHYRNFVGQRRLPCKAGTMALVHGGLWHCGQPNRSTTDRCMFKIRFKARESQRGLFDTTHAGDEDVEQFIYEYRAAAGGARGVMSVNRARLWRYLTGNDEADVSQEGVLTRMGL